MTIALGSKSLQRLTGVHPDLVRVVRAAAMASDLDFCVLEGLRTLERQKQLVAAGASQTLNSRHLTGHAVDVAAKVGGQVRWDWPLYYKLAVAFKRAAEELQIAIEWGGDWKSFKDGPHFQLSAKRYPV
jgi:peptidoglycan L-alanyl-D-glutamate endopeptidase CwlK